MTKRLERIKTKSIQTKKKQQGQPSYKNQINKCRDTYDLHMCNDEIEVTKIHHTHNTIQYNTEGRVTIRRLLFYNNSLSRHLAYHYPTVGPYRGQNQISERISKVCLICYGDFPRMIEVNMYTFHSFHFREMQL